MGNYAWVPWLIASLSLAWAISSWVITHREKQAEKEQASDSELQKRVTELEIQRRLDQNQYQNDLKMIHHRLNSAMRAARDAGELVRKALSHD